MGFLSPALLALGAAIAVPLILHLFQRHQGPRVVFPALRYLRRAEKEHARRIRLRQLLLMLLRVAALALLALAAARPFLRAAGSAHQPTAVVLVLDNSMSTSVVTGDQRLLDELKARALQTVAASESEDIFWLIRAGSPWEPAWSGDAEMTAQRIRQTEPTSAAADLVAAVERARTVLETGAGQRATEIHLLSDLQATGLATVADTATRPPLVVWVPGRRPPRNLAIGAIDVGGGVAPIAGQRSTVAALVAGDSSADSVNVRMALEGRVIAAATAPVGSSTVLPFPARPTGFVSGWVEKDVDELRPDDRRYFATRVAPPPTVGTGGPLGLVDDALAVLELAGRIRRAPLREAEVAILPAARGAENAPAGQNLIVVPPDSLLDLAGTNRRLAAAGIRWAFETISGSGVSRFDVSREANGPLRTLEQVRLSTVFRLLPQSATSDTVLLRLADGTAWALRGPRPGGGQYVVLSSPLSETASTLPTTAALLPLLDRMLSAWVANRPSVTEALPGQQIALPARATVVETPDGTPQPASGTFDIGADAGVYRILAGDSVLALVAVNPPAAESNLERADERRLRNVFGGTPLVTADSPEAWGRRIYQQRVGREMWRWLALLALAVLVIESLVAATGAVTQPTRRRAAPAERSASERRETLPAGG